MTPAAGVPDSDADPVATLSWDQVLAWRSDRHHLTQREPQSSMMDVVRTICGLHAQLHSSAQLSLWTRIDELDSDAVDRALWQERSLVKTWAMRGTLHYLPAEEYPLWQAMLSTYRHYRKGSWLRHFGFADENELDAVITAVGEILRVEPLGREGLAAAVADELDDPAVAERLRDSWGSTLKPAAFNGQLCYAPSDSQNVRFTHPDAWLGEHQSVDPDRAIREVTRRYLAAYGPATRDQYAKWAGLQPAEAGRRIDMLGDDVSVVEIDGSPAWLLTTDVSAAVDATPSGTVRLLPRFDPYTVGAPRDEPAICPVEHVDRVYRSGGWISAVLLVDGCICGVWEYEQAGEEVQITIDAFESVDESTRDAAAIEAERLADFFGGLIGARLAILLISLCSDFVASQIAFQYDMSARSQTRTQRGLDFGEILRLSIRFGNNFWRVRLGPFN